MPKIRVSRTRKVKNESESESEREARYYAQASASVIQPLRVCTGARIKEACAVYAAAP